MTSILILLQPMKNFAYLLLPVLFCLGLSTGAHAQASHKPATQPAVAKPICEYCILKDGNMMMVIQGKQMTPMTADITMSDGSMCLNDGTCRRPDGTLLTLREGQCMMMDGKLTMNPGPVKRAPMKASARKNKMKM